VKPSTTAYTQHIPLRKELFKLRLFFFYFTSPFDTFGRFQNQFFFLVGGEGRNPIEALAGFLVLGQALISQKSLNTVHYPINGFHDLYITGMWRDT